MKDNEFLDQLSNDQVTHSLLHRVSYELCLPQIIVSIHIDMGPHLWLYVTSSTSFLQSILSPRCYVILLLHLNQSDCPTSRDRQGSLSVAAIQCQRFVWK
jgi:hypothetical protein